MSNGLNALQRFGLALQGPQAMAAHENMRRAQMQDDALRQFFEMQMGGAGRGKALSPEMLMNLPPAIQTHVLERMAPPNPVEALKSQLALEKLALELENQRNAAATQGLPAGQMWGNDAMGNRVAVPIPGAASPEQVLKDREKIQGQQQLAQALDQLDVNFDTLKDRKGLFGSSIVSQDDTWLGRALSRVAADNEGMFWGALPSGSDVQKIVDPEAEKTREQIRSSTQLLKNYVKKATGMSAAELNSNVELKSFLEALASPTNTYEGSQAIIGNLRQMFLPANQMAAPSAASGAAVNSGFSVGQTARNPQTGERVQWNGSAWQPVAGAP